MSKLTGLYAICESVMEFALVEQMLAAKKQLAGAQSDKEKDFYTNRCDGLDRQISGPRPVFTHGGSGRPLVSGAKGSISNPTR